MILTDRELSRHELALELHKILEMLAGETTCPKSREMALCVRPDTDLAVVRRELLRVSDAYTLAHRFGSPRLGGMRDPGESLRRAKADGVLSMAELLGVGSALRTIRTVAEWKRQSSDTPTALDEFFGRLEPNRYFEDKIQRCIQSEEMMDDRASPELGSIRRKIRQAGLHIREQLDKMIRSPMYQRYLQDAIVTIRDGRFVVPVKAEHRGEIKGLLHDTSGSGATVFIEPMSVVELNNDIRLLEGKEQAEIQRILAELSEEAAGFADSILHSYDMLVELDLYFARANLGIRMKAQIPEVSDDGVIDLVKARHPLIPYADAVPIDIRVGDGFHVLVITGPNTGGKTVALKTLGLLSLMAMCGMMIPAAEKRKVSVFRRVLADIGDEQSIEQSLSTFSSHMTNIVGIMAEADDQSLILIDELGAGTDPVEGAALAISILERLRVLNCRVAATTHYAEIKMYAVETDGVENASCEFDVATLRPTYRLLIGLPGRSNAFAISERLGMDTLIVDRARELVSRENTRFEDIVLELEAAKKELENEKQEIARLKEQAVEAGRQANTALQQTKREQLKELERTKAESKRVIETVRMQAERLIDELDEIRKLQNTDEFATRAARAKSELRARMAQMEDTADPVIQPKATGTGPSRPLKKGDRVMIADIGKEAIVIQPDAGNGMVWLQAGIVKTTVALTNLRLVKEPGPSSGAVTSRVTKDVAPRGEGKIEDEINVINLTVEEALLEVDRFVDGAVMSGLETVRIVHGKGTGALRSAIGAHLRRHKNVRTHRLGTFGEGETGVTIVTLK